MKKSIVLLITMLFISAISLLVMDNLKDSEKFIDNSQNSINFTQTNISILNINEQLIKQLNEIDKNDLEVAFEYIQLLNVKTIGTMNISNLNPSILNIQSYYDITKDYTNTLDTYLIDNIDYRYDLFALTKDINITNNRQLQNVISEYIEQTKDDKILNILEDNKFLVKYYQYKDTNNTKTFISCNYDIKVNNLKSHVDLIFEHKKDIKYFDFYVIGNTND